MGAANDLLQHPVPPLLSSQGACKAQQPAVARLLGAAVCLQLHLLLLWAVVQAFDSFVLAAVVEAVLLVLVRPTDVQRTWNVGTSDNTVKSSLAVPL